MAENNLRVPRLGIDAQTHMHEGSWTQPSDHKLRSSSAISEAKRDLVDCQGQAETVCTISFASPCPYEYLSDPGTGVDFLAMA